MALACPAAVGVAAASGPELLAPWGATSPPCAPALGSLRPEDTLGDHAGSYDLTLVVGVSDSTTHRRSVAGRLTLRARSAEAPRFGAASTPLHGSADVDLRRVGAHAAGDPASVADDAPGVLVLETTVAGRRSVLLRFGATANRAGVVRYDGAYTVLDVTEVSARGFSGAWRSGVSEGPTVGGWFCARPREPPPAPRRS